MKTLSFFAILLLLCFFKNISYANNPQKPSYSKFFEQEKLFEEDNYYLLYDPDLDEVLIGNNHHQRIAPSSMTKLMTAYVVFSQLASKFIQLDDYCLIGKDAWNKNGSTMFLDYGDVVQISDLLKGLLVMSGNDASIALAQTTVAGGYDSFINSMNAKAVELGMYNTNFRNPHGLNEEGHYSTLMDLAILTKRLYQDFPQYMEFLQIEEFEYSGIYQKNRNPLIKHHYDGIIGGKTGYTSQGGYGVATIVKRNYRKLIAVVNNMANPQEREEAISKLLDFGFNNFKKIYFFKKGDILTDLDIWLGEKQKISAIIDRDIIINIPYKINSQDIEVEVKYLKPLIAPIATDQKIADLYIKIKDYDSFHYNIYANQDVKKVGLLPKVKLILNQKRLDFVSLFN